MRFAKERGRRPLPLALRLFSLSLSVCVLAAMHHPARADASSLTTTPTRVTPASDSLPKDIRHFDVSGTTFSHAIAAIVGGRNRRADERAEAKRRLRREAPGTYIGEILDERDSTLTRWPSRANTPLTVWIQPTTKVADFTTAYADRVRDAFGAWNNLALPVRFAFVNDSARAEVHVTWIDRFDQPISGRTRWGRDDTFTMTDANITLAMHHYQGELLDEDSMRAMAMHEIGHLLGLDHTTDSSSIMAPKVRVRELSEIDRATVRLLYSLPPGQFR